MVFNPQVSLTDLSLFGLRRGGQWVGIGNYVELLTSREFRRVLYNTTVWLTLVGVSVRIVLGVVAGVPHQLRDPEAVPAADALPRTC